MSVSLYDLLKRDIKKMAQSLTEREQGNIHMLVMQEVERYLLEVVLEETKYNYLRAARALGISRSTLYRKLETHGISEEKFQKIPHVNN